MIEVDRKYSNEDLFLSCIIKNSNLLYSATEEIEDGYMRQDDSASLYRVILDIKRSPGTPIEKEAMIKNGVLLNYYQEKDKVKVEKLSGYINFLRNSSVKPQEIKQFKEAVKEKYFSSQFWKATSSATKKIEENKGKGFKHIFQLHSEKIDDISAAYHGKRELVHIAEGTDEHLKELAKNQGQPAGVCVKRFPILMDILNGFMPGKLYVFGARPKTGKSTYAQNLATEISQFLPVLFIDTEQTEDEYRVNYLANLSYFYDTKKKQHLGISTRDISNGSFATDEYLAKAIDVAKKKINTNQLFHYYMGEPSIDAVKSVVSRFCHYAEEVVSKEDILLHRASCVIFYDWMKTSASMQAGAPRTRNQEFQVMGDFADALSIIAKKHRVPVIAFAQNNREDKKDIKESEADSYKSEIVQFDRVAHYCHAFMWLADMQEKTQDRIGKQNGNKLMRVTLNRHGATNTFGICYYMLGNFAHFKETQTLKQLLKEAGE